MIEAVCSLIVEAFFILTRLRSVTEPHKRPTVHFQGRPWPLSGFLSTVVSSVSGQRTQNPGNGAPRGFLRGRLRDHRPLLDIIV